MSTAAATRKLLDVSNLPDGALDHRSPIWWANLMLLFIETTMFAILVGCYFYYRLVFDQWPPVQPNTIIPDYHPVPALPLATVNLFVILLSCVPMILADRAALKHDERLVRWGMVGTIGITLVAIVLRWLEFDSLKFRWDENAYGSITWMILGMHFTHLIVGTCENGILAAWLFMHGMDEKHARDVRVGALYWYWVGLVWVPLYAIVFVGPRFYHY